MVNSIFQVSENTASAQLPIATLKDVAHVRDFKNRMPKSFPVEAYELYDRVGNILSKVNGHSIVTEDLIVPVKSIRIVGWREKDKEAPLVNHMLEQHVGAFKIVKKGDKEQSIGAAIACSQKGITIAYGTRVWSCANQCVFGEKIMSTFGNNSTPFERMMDTLMHWAEVHDEIRQNEFAIIGKMKDITLDYDSIRNLVGDLYIRSRQRNMEGKTYLNDMNVSEVGRLTDAVITAGNNNQNDEGVSLIDGGIDTNLWDFYNQITEILNPKTSYDPVSVFDTTNAVTQYIVDKYNIPVQDYSLAN